MKIIPNLDDIVRFGAFLTSRDAPDYLPNLDPCWIFNGSKRRGGYGQFAIRRNAHIKHYTAHRFAWEIYKGDIPSDVCVLHKCDVRECVNPTHLFLGTRADNNRDCIAKGRWNTPFGE